MAPRNLVKCTDSPLSGLWSPQPHLRHLFYGAGCVEQHLLGVIPQATSRVFIITGRSLATATPLVRQLETLLGPRHAGTFAGIRQHGPEADVDVAYAAVVAADPPVDTLLALGGGSPIDAAKTVSYRLARRGPTTAAAEAAATTTTVTTMLIAVPTTLSAAECTPGGGYMRQDGTKVGMMDPASMGAAAVFYDADFIRHTPRRVLLASGVRAVDHAVETVWHPHASEVPWKALAAWALGVLVEGLERVAEMLGAEDAAALDDLLTRLQLGAFATSGLRGANFNGRMGLSHALGHALGSPYGISHGETSCMTLAPVIRLQARRSPDAAAAMSRLLLPALGMERSGDARADGEALASRIDDMVVRLGLVGEGLSARGVQRGEIPVIARRALRAELEDVELIKEVENLVERLF